jgi:short-subunit dehydrogenase
MQPIALVTGASSGFGHATSARLLTLGFHVIGTSRAGSGGPPGVEMIALDVDRDVDLGDRRVDVLVNNAGRALVGACEETTAAEARALFETNVFGVMRVTAAVLPGMRARRAGAIVNVGSASGIVGVPFHGVYAATKHALAGYTEALRAELRAFGIRVAIVEPGAHRTPIQMIRPANLIADYDAGRERVEAIIRDQIDTGPDPSHVVDAIVEAATCARPRARYRIGASARKAALGRRFLTDRAFERLLRREFRL